MLIYKKPHRTGEVFMRYLCLYGLFRFLIEFVRGDQELYFFLTIPQWTSLFLVAGAFILGARIVRGGRS